MKALFFIASNDSSKMWDLLRFYKKIIFRDSYVGADCPMTNSDCIEVAFSKYFVLSLVLFAVVFSLDNNKPIKEAN